jgi:hypothetical protein
MGGANLGSKTTIKSIHQIPKLTEVVVLRLQQVFQPRNMLPL